MKKARIKPSTKAERQHVFYAYRDIFAEKKAFIRTNKAIHGLVLQHWSSRKSLVGGCGIRKVVHILKALLGEGIFDSEAQASKDFLKLFPEPSQKRIASLERIEREGTSKDPEHPGDPRTDSIERKHALFALEPPQFPYETQHRILSTTQQLLEESCFNFVKKWLPSVLDQLSWNSAAAGELTEWLNILRRYERDLPDGCISTEGQVSLKNIAPAVAQLRHTAVHRLHLTSEELLDQIRSAYMLAEVLQDATRTSTLQALYAVADTQTKKMERDTVAMQQEVDTTMVQIQTQKEALAQREQQLLSYAARRKIDIPIVTGLALLESVNAVLASGKPTMIVQKQCVGGCDESAAQAYGVIVEDDDIESDEDRLQAELR